MSININLQNYNIVDNSELEYSSSNSTNKLVENLINEPINVPINDLINVSINDSINELIKNNIENNETIVELPVKKKKGRKSKKVKELELGEEKPIEPVKRFPKLSEKIFDVLQISDVEYFYDTDFNLLLDSNVNPVGFKHDKKFIFYSETINDINQVKKDDEEFNNIIEKIK